MKETMVLSVDREQSKTRIFELLLEVYPLGFQKTNLTFNCILNWDDPRVSRIQQILDNAGLRSWSGIIRRQPAEYWITRRRDYGPDDYAECLLLQPFGRWKSDFSLALRLPDGRLEIEPRFFKRRIFFAMNFTPSFIVSREVRGWMESAALKGMIFKPTAKEMGCGAADESNLWELTSEVVMPRMSPNCTWFDEEGKPTVGDPDSGRIYKEGLYSPPEFHYLKSSIDQMTETDIAVTWERFYQSRASQHRRLVVSKRFFDFCINHNLDMNWVPVRIDPDK